MTSAAFDAVAGDKRLAAICLGAVVVAHLIVLAALPGAQRPAAEQPLPLSVTLIALEPPRAAAPPTAPIEQPAAVAARKAEPSRAPVQPPVQALSPPLRVPPGPALARPALPDAGLEAPSPAPAPAPAASPPDFMQTAPAASANAGRAGTAPAGGSERSEAPKPALVPPRYDAAYLDNPKPDYPRLARRLGEQGTVLLDVYVGSSGQPEKIELRKSSGSPRLDQAARDTVRRWRFVPARQGDGAVAAWLVVPITFVLEG